MNKNELDPEDPKHIIDITDVSHLVAYKKMKRENKPLLVCYYMNGCGYCDAMKEEWTNFTENRKRDPSVNIVKIESSFIPPDEGVMGYPTIKLFNVPKKNTIEFNSNRTEEEFNQFLSDNISKKGGGARNKKRSNRRNKLNKRSNRKRSNRKHKRSYRKHKRSYRKHKRSNRRQRGGKGMLDHIEDKMQVLENMLGNYSYDK